MSARQQLSDLFISLMGDEPIMVIHSSLPNFKLPESISKWDFLYALNTLLNAGKTIALPAFNYAACAGRPYHYEETPSNVGLLADWAKDLVGAKRSAHPTHSYVVAGRCADELIECSLTSTFGVGSILEKFEKIGAQIIMFGCDWDVCTQIHHYEEEANVPYRYQKTFECDADFGEGQKHIHFQTNVRYLELDFENDLSQMVQFLNAEKAIKKCIIWGGNIQSVSCYNVAKACRSLLENNKFALIENPKIVEAQISSKKAQATQDPINVAILGHSNTEFIKNALHNQLSNFVPDRQIKLYSPDYGQAESEIINPASQLNDFDANFTIFISRLEDLMGQFSLDLCDQDTLLSAVENYCQRILDWREINNKTILVFNFASLAPLKLEATLDSKINRSNDIVTCANDILVDNLAGIGNITLLDLAEYSSAFSGGPVIDERMWFLGRFPFSESFSSYLARKITGHILVHIGRTARLIVLDLDNTLWGGVLGEDGPTGLELGGDFPGNIFKTFQQKIKILSTRGFAIAVCSKNDQDHALKTIDELPEMVLRSDDFVAHAINWEPKWQNLQKMVTTLGLGLKNVIFIDDNPAEREQIKQNLPDVHVLDVSSDPLSYIKALDECPALESGTITREDLNRVNSYRHKQKVDASRGNYDNIEAFYASLDTSLHIQKMDDGNQARALQLIQKTNQFNTTTKRYSLKDLQDMQSSGAQVYVIGAEDKFNSKENIGVLIVKWQCDAENIALIDNYLLSCRTLGKGVETAILSWVKNQAAKKGIQKLFGPIIETERNTPARKVYQNSAFDFDDTSNQWIYNICETEDLCHWVNYVDHT